MKQKTTAYLRRHKWVVYIIASLLLCIFFWQYLFTGNRLIVGDFDYYSQLYEGARISVLNFHQFPSWNPWMAGGLPLFANPQFGLFSVQFLLVLLFGAIYGLKLAYVLYALAGFWGMYLLGRRVLRASAARSLLIAYLWIFCGFFAGHGISHFTFSSFYLLPWLLDFVFNRHGKYSWAWLGLFESIIILSSIHYAFLMTGFVVSLFFLLSLVKKGSAATNGLRSVRFSLTKSDMLFVVKAGLLIFVLCSYRFITTYLFIRNNPKIPALLIDHPNSPKLLVEAIFLPFGTFLKSPSGLQWGWWEYSMYFGIGTGIAVLLVLFLWIRAVLVRHEKLKVHISNPRFVISLLGIGFVAFLFALGDFSNLAPYHLLRLVPGFSDTRVAARWLFFTMFSLLLLLGSWKTHRRALNCLLLLGAVELFFSFGPPHVTGADQLKLPPSHFSTVLSQYNNGYKHLDMASHPLHSYFYATSENVGEIYADDSSVDTLDKVIGTNLCGTNTNPHCALVLTHNGMVAWWSPNEIRIVRTAPGPIQLDMNVASGWRVNGQYPYAGVKQIDPTIPFILGGNSGTYDLKYAPKLSPDWLGWRLGKL